MDQNNIIECGGFYFIHNFDSGNLGHVERVPTDLIVPSVINTAKTSSVEIPDYEFNLWTRPDCAGTEFENGNRTWFYFGVQASEPNVLVRLNIINLNKQGKMYNQGMAPVTRTLPGKPQWERIRDRPVHTTDDNTFTLSFKYKTAENVKATTFFAFTYPFSFAELQIALNSIDMKMLPLAPPQSPDDIYYCRECLIYSLEGRRVDLLTISSYHGITNEREERLKHLFPDNLERPYKFHNKKVIFISARVHPGETPSSFVFNGFLNLLLNRNDPIAIQLRKLYVFKMIPFLNPDGVARGHYRTDTRGVNLNRVYLNPSLALHPTVYASRALIRFYHFGTEREDNCEDSRSYGSRSFQNISESAELIDSRKKKSLTNTNASNYKSGDYRDSKKPERLKLSMNKSGTMIKMASDSRREDSKDYGGETTNLVDQVYDMTIREMPSQTCEKPSLSNLEASPSILNEQTLKSCLGSTVHLSTSEELNIQGSNPLRSLRDTLKNSISLLMESSAGDSSLGGKDSRLTNVKMGWCKQCRAAVSKFEETMPGITDMVPSYSNQKETPTYYTIEEYREHQKRQLEDIEKPAENKDYDGDDETDESCVYFCTNCFKRYRITNDKEEILCPPVCETVSVTSVAVSAGDSESIRSEVKDTVQPAASTGDTLPPPPTPPKEDKEKPRAKNSKKKLGKAAPAPPPPPKEPESGLYLYIDLHGHASKKGIFMYGNHFDELDNCVECMLLPRIMSLNNLHFHFSSCNFTERNMYLKDRRDGMSREGSGRVAVLKATGLVRSYTLECNYNTGRLVNILPPTVRDGPGSITLNSPGIPPKYTPHIFEEVKRPRMYLGPNLEVFEEINPQEVGRSLGASILDLTGQHPNSRIPCSEHRNLSALREWLRAHTKTMRPQLSMPRVRTKTLSPTPLYVRSRAKVIDERKENAYHGRDTERRRSPPVQPQRSGHDVVCMKMGVGKKNEPIKSTSRTRYDVDPKPKSLTSKRRNILAIRKPNASKTQVGKTKARRSADDSESTLGVKTKLNKRTYNRGARLRCRAMASSSSDSSAATARRRALPPPPAPPPLLKKLRLRAAL